MPQQSGSQKLLIFSNFIGPFFALLLGPVLARELGPEGRGFYAAIINSIVLIGILGTFGSQHALGMLLVNKKISISLSLSLLNHALLVCTIPALIILFVINQINFGSDYVYLRYSFLLMIFLPFQILQNLLYGVANGIGDFRLIAYSKIQVSFGRFLFLTILCLSFSLTAITAAFVVFLSQLPSILWCKRKLAPYRDDRHPVGISTRDFLNISVKSFTGLASSILLNRFDQIIGLSIIGPRQLGFYAVAVAIAEIPDAVSSSSRIKILGTRIAKTNEIQSIIRLTWLGTMFISATIGILGTLLVPHIFGVDFQSAVIPLIILCFAAPMNSISLCLTAVLITSENQVDESKSYFYASIVGISSLIALGQFGAIGASISSLVGYTICLIVSWFYVSQKLGWKFTDCINPQIDDFKVFTTSIRDKFRGDGEKTFDK